MSRPKLLAHERRHLLQAWPWPEEAATTATGFADVVAAVEDILAGRRAVQRENRRTRFGLTYNRTHGAARMLRERAASARAAAEGAESHAAAALSGKARGYLEAANIVEALDRDRRLPRRARWERRREPVVRATLNDPVFAGQDRRTTAEDGTA